jgi:hypothetical protein
MAKPRRSHATRRSPQTSTVDEATRTKRELARQVRERQKISKLSRQLERAILRATSDALGLARFIALRNGYILSAREDQEETLETILQRALSIGSVETIRAWLAEYAPQAAGRRPPATSTQAPVEAPREAALSVD